MGKKAAKVKLSGKAKTAARKRARLAANRHLRRVRKGTPIYNSKQNRTGVAQKKVGKYATKVKVSVRYVTGRQKGRRVLRQWAVSHCQIET